MEFAPGADNPVDSILADRFERAVSSTKQENPALKKLWISATTNDHTWPSLHVDGFAIDVSRVNGIRMLGAYGRNPLVTSVVESLQVHIGIQGAYENYGPMFMEGPRPHSVPVHNHHIHFAIRH
jgi:hypothetical protein